MPAQAVRHVGGSFSFVTEEDGFRRFDWGRSVEARRKRWSEGSFLGWRLSRRWKSAVTGAAEGCKFK